MVSTRAIVLYIGMEWGVAGLYGKSMEQYARALIEIAHPNFREKPEEDSFMCFGSLQHARKIHEPAPEPEKGSRQSPLRSWINGDFLRLFYDMPLQLFLLWQVPVHARKDTTKSIM